MLDDAHSRSPLRPGHRRAGLAAALLLAAGLACPAAAAPADTVFTVGNYPVEARADNAVAAKDKALADGQMAALRSLLKRLVPVTAHARLRAIQIAKPAQLLEGMRVRSERNSATDYLASLDFSFQPNGIRALLQREGLPFVEEQAPTLTLLAVGRTTPDTPVKDDPTWTAVWKGLDLEHALSPVKLEPFDARFDAAAVAALAKGDGSALRSLVAKARSELVVVAVLEPEAGGKKIAVTLAGRDAVGAFTLRRTYKVDPNDPGYAAELAGVVSLGILDGRWKAIAAGGAQTALAPQGANTTTLPGQQQQLQAQQMQQPQGGGAAMQVAVEFKGMGEWTEISRRLAATPGIQDLDVAGLSQRGARVTFRYAGSPQQLAQALDQQGLSLRNAGGAWVLAAR